MQIRTLFEKQPSQIINGSEIDILKTKSKPGNVSMRISSIESRSSRYCFGVIVVLFLLYKISLKNKCMVQLENAFVSDLLFKLKIIFIVIKLIAHLFTFY